MRLNLVQQRRLSFAPAILRYLRHHCPYLPEPPCIPSPHPTHNLPRLLRATGTQKWPEEDLALTHDVGAAYILFNLVTPLVVGGLLLLLNWNNLQRSM